MTIAPDPTTDTTGAASTKTGLHVVKAAAHPAFFALNKIEEEVNNQFFERSEAIHAIILALLCKEHGFLLGTPGTGKTYLIRTIMGRIAQAVYFEQIMSKTRPTDAILGPYDIPKLRDHGQLLRKTKGYLPEAVLAMLDEVGKMPPTLGHDLLSIVLDRLFHQVDSQGNSTQQVPLHSFFGGSNELPTDESPDAAALWDRILVRVPVDALKERANFIRLLQTKAMPPDNPTTLNYPDLLDAADNVVPNINVPNNVFDVVIDLRDQLEKEGIAPSERRWVQAMKLPRAAAFMEGRDEVEVIDLGSLVHALWDKPEDLRVVRKLTLTLSDPLAEEAMQFYEKIEELAMEVDKAKNMSLENRGKSVMTLNRNVAELRSKIGAAKNKALAAGHPTKRFDEALMQASKVQASILHDLLQVSDEPDNS